jgi:hypothetical protein
MNSDPETSLFLGDLLNKSPSNVKFRRAAFFCGVRPENKQKSLSLSHSIIYVIRSIRHRRCQIL